MQANLKAQAVRTEVFVTMESPTQDKITSNGVTIYLPGYFNQEEYATVVATCHSVGGRCKLGIQAGETVAIDYKVTADYTTVEGQKVYNRAYVLNGEVVWKVDEFMVLAVLRDGKWQGVGNWCLFKEILEKKEVIKSDFLIIPEWSETETIPGLEKPKPQKGIAQYVSGKLNIPAGATVHINEAHRSLYRFPDGQIYVVLKDGEHDNSILAYENCA